MVLFLLVAFVRFYRGRHSLFDIGVGIGVAVVLYWTFVLLTAVITARREAERRLLGEFVVPLGAFALALVFYAQETKWWLYLCLSIVLMCSVVFNLTKSSDMHEPSR